MSCASFVPFSHGRCPTGSSRLTELGGSAPSARRGELAGLPEGAPPWAAASARAVAGSTSSVLHPGDPWPSPPDAQRLKSRFYLFPCVFCLALLSFRREAKCSSCYAISEVNINSVSNTGFIKKMFFDNVGNKYAWVHMGINEWPDK